MGVSNAATTTEILTRGKRMPVITKKYPTADQRPIWGLSLTI
jgi:hypothetical protein